MFSNQDLKNMIIPLFFEQLLVMLVGIIDTFVISYAGEAAVSGVSLVNSFNTVFIYLFTALASGGAVVISQYLGSKNSEEARRSSGQLLMFSTVFSLIMMVLTLVFKDFILHLLFGKAEADVMMAAQEYLRISAYSYPALAIYNVGVSMYRSMGKTSTTLYISLISNVINTVGNLIGVFVLHAGVAGVAWPSLIARLFSAVAITVLLFGKKDEVYYEKKHILALDTPLLKRILGIAVPNGLENGIFQLVKVALGSVVAMFGTYQIAANGTAQSIWSMAALMGVTMNSVFITVIGQCMGSGDVNEAKKYVVKLMKLTLVLSITWNTLIFVCTPFILHFYALSDITKDLTVKLVLIHNVFNAFAYPFAFCLSSGLRAAGDVKFTAAVSIFSTLFGRLLFSFVFGVWMNLGVIGIAMAMCLDWLIRAVIFAIRYRSGKWTSFKVI